MNRLSDKKCLETYCTWRNVRLRVGVVPVSRATQVTYTSLYHGDNWIWLREVTPLSKLE